MFKNKLSILDWVARRALFLFLGGGCYNIVLPAKCDKLRTHRTLIFLRHSSVFRLISSRFCIPVGGRLDRSKFETQWNVKTRVQLWYKNWCLKWRSLRGSILESTKRRVTFMLFSFGKLKEKHSTMKLLFVACQSMVGGHRKTWYSNRDLILNQIRHLQRDPPLCCWWGKQIIGLFNAHAPILCKNGVANYVSRFEKNKFCST